MELVQPNDQSFSWLHSRIPDLGMVVSNRSHCNLDDAGSQCGLFNYLTVDLWLTLVCWSRLQEYFFPSSKWFQWAPEWALCPLVISLRLTIMPRSVHAQHERAMCKFLNFTYSDVQTMFKQDNYTIRLFDVKQIDCYHSFNIVKYNLT